MAFSTPTLSYLTFVYFVIVVCYLSRCPPTSAWSTPSPNNAANGNKIDASTLPTSSSSARRQFLSFVVGGCTASSMLLTSPPSATAVTRAIGGAEEACRAAGNCLEIGELDGAVGWTWGAADRCDATDPKCGPDGKLLDEIPQGEPVPTITNKITDIIQMTFQIGKTESFSIKLGLYGEDAPKSVEQFLKFMTTGLITTSSLTFESGMGVRSTPVSMSKGGILGTIVPNQRLDFGIPSQANAYARTRGLSKAGEDFLPQPKPTKIEDEISVRNHDVAGLLSIPSKGIGYGGTGFESDDECFESSFEITGSRDVANMDKEGRRVIGQVVDEQSMASLARLVSLPTKKGFKGVIPGQNVGPPLIKVTISDISIVSTK